MKCKICEKDSAIGSKFCLDCMPRVEFMYYGNDFINLEWIKGAICGTIAGLLTGLLIYLTVYG